VKYLSKQAHILSCVVSSENFMLMVIFISANYLLGLRFQVLKVASMKITVLLDVVTCSLVEVYRRFKGACCLQHQSDVWASEMSLNFHQITRRNNPEHSNLHLTGGLQIS
jgi:hypothetical protein